MNDGYTVVKQTFVNIINECWRPALVLLVFLLAIYYIVAVLF